MAVQKTAEPRSARTTEAAEAEEAAAGPERLMAAELADEIEFLTARARSVGSGRANIALKELDLKVRSYSVLSLACSDLNPSQRELADFLSLDPSQIVALVDELERRGAVTREADARDRRSKVIAATPEGRRLYKQAFALVRTSEEHSLGELSHEERGQLRALLRRIAFKSAD
ncbi:ranscriptional regulator [Arthrobacter mangrovi]|uniref:Ranscriptional regulator n=2 Tax=Arthrobacter mangrovi TaxID=2966350 RepID=A0ABQ5MZG7_9MICC|nr:MarR family transcriptional regulator [Arthrobacter mangrovi]GLB69338.1 ranscriptional regulator [Arthrobacter mangrovi]